MTEGIIKGCYYHIMHYYFFFCFRFDTYVKNHESSTCFCFFLAFYSTVFLYLHLLSHLSAHKAYYKHAVVVIIICVCVCVCDCGYFATLCYMKLLLYLLYNSIVMIIVCLQYFNVFIAGMTNGWMMVGRLVGWLAGWLIL